MTSNPPTIADFNPTLVQFKQGGAVSMTQTIRHFNPTLVQFKRAAVRDVLRLEEFQSYLSPIQTDLNTIVCSVGVGYFTPTLVQFKLTSPP